MKIKLFLLIILVAGPGLIGLAQVPQPTQPETAPTPEAPTNAVAASTNIPPPEPPPPSLPVTGSPTMVPETAPTNQPALASTNIAEGDLPSDITFDELPLPDAIRQLASLAGLNIVFDRKLDQPPTDPATHAPLPFPTVKEKWKNLTAMQALHALLSKYDWQMKQDPATPVVIITAKEPNAVEPQVMKVILLGYSEPTNIVYEVTQALPNRVTVIPDLRTHQVIVRTTEREMPAVEKLIADLDSATGPGIDRSQDHRNHQGHQHGQGN
jgi:hypothetical protein